MTPAGGRCPGGVSSSLTTLTNRPVTGTVDRMTSDTREYVEQVGAAFVKEFSAVIGDEIPADDPAEVGRRAAIQAAASGAWNSLIGPFTDTAGAAEALGGVTRQAVNQRLTTKSLLGLRLAGHTRPTFVFPVWQFHDDVMDDLPMVLATAGYDRDRPETGWTIASWMRSSDDRFGNLTPFELLLKGDIEVVLQLARDLAYGLATESPVTE